MILILQILQIQATHLAHIHVYASKETFPGVKVRLILSYLIFYDFLQIMPYRQCTFKVLACQKMSPFHSLVLIVFKSFPLRTLKEFFHCFLEYGIFNKYSSYSDFYSF